MTYPPPKQRPDKGLSWWAFLRFTWAFWKAYGALLQLKRLAKLTGALGCEIQAGIAMDSLSNEFEVDREAWSCRKSYGAYQRRGLPVPRECLEAELRHAERLAKKAGGAP